MQIRALIFAAVSSEEQALPGKPSLDKQIEECRAAIAQNGWLEVGVIRAEGQSRDYALLSQLIANSPDFARLVEMIDQKAMQVVVCSSYDRLWRTDAIRAQIGYLARERGVHLYSCAQPIPLESADDAGYWIQILSGVGAEMENREKVRRHRRGMHGRVEAGLHPLGAPPYGYDRAQNNKLPTPQNPVEIVWVKMIFQQLLAGVSMRRVVETLRENGVRTRRGGQWEISTIDKIVTNPYYAGGIRYRHWRWSKDRKPGSKRHHCLGMVDEVIHWTGKHEAIITRQEWERLQRMLQAHPIWRDQCRLGPWALHGLLRCGYCGWAMVRLGKQGPHPAIRCGQYTSTHGRKCQNNGHRLYKIENFVLTEVKKLLTDPVIFTQALQERNNNGHQLELDSLQKQLANLNASMNNIYTAIESGRFEISVLAARYEELQSSKNKVEQRIHEINSEWERMQSFQQTAIHLSDAIEELDHLSPEELGQIYRQLIEAVYLRRNEPPEISWLFA